MHAQISAESAYIIISLGIVVIANANIPPLSWFNLLSRKLVCSHVKMQLILIYKGFGPPKIIK